MEKQLYNFDNFYKPLIILSNLFCLQVPDVQTKKISKVYLTYTLLVISALIIGFVWSVENIIACTVVFDTKAYVDILINCSMTATNVISILWCVVIRRKAMLRVVEKIKEVDGNLNVNKEFKSRQRSIFLVEMALLHLLVLSCAIYESYELIDVFDFNHYRAHFNFYINLYMVILTVLKIYHFSMALKYRFALLNKKLFRFKTNLNLIIMTESHGTRVRFYRKHHLLLCESVNLMSDVFGIQIFFITMLIIAFIVQAFNTGLTYANGKDKSEAYELILVCVWNTGNFILFAIMMASSCEQTIEEKNRTQRICHKLLILLPVYMTKSQELIREELRIFAKQIDQEEVQFSAMGFFSVDHTLLLTIFGSIATYVIILIQFL